MRKRKRKENVTYILATILIFGVMIIAFWYKLGDSGKTYAIKNGSSYKYVTEREVKVTYLGNNTYLSEDGNIWNFQGVTSEKGKQYKMLLHDNGTETIITDDVVVSVYK